MVSGSKARDYSFDNIRFLLIFSVVFAHLLEIAAPFWGSWILYKVIYSFHMPCFIFLFGYFVKYKPDKIVFHWVLPYLVFQTYYLIFQKLFLKNEFVLQYTTPYWLLWYMMVCIFYQLLIPVFDTSSRRKQGFTVFCVFILALAVGYDYSVGYYLSLSRFFVFQPWFVLGYYCGKNNWLNRIDDWKGGSRKLVSIFLTLGIVLSSAFLYIKDVPNSILYGSYSYAELDGAIFVRGLVLLTAFIWISFIILVIRPRAGKKIPIISRIGQNTLPVFLMHGFIVKLVQLYYPELVSTPWGVILLTCMIVLLLGNVWAKKLINRISFSWVENNIQKLYREHQTLADT